MITIKQQEKLIERFETLSELELDSVLEELVAHLEKNHLWHLLEKHTGADDLENEVEDLEQKVTELEEDIHEYKDSMREIENVCDSVEETQEFEDGAFDELKAALNKIKNLT